MPLTRNLLGGLAAACLAACLTRAAVPAPTKGPEPLQISHGQPVKIEDYLVPGKTTVVDFYSKFCPPCMALAPLIEQLHRTRTDLAVVEVDINRPGVVGIDWQSPVVREFQLDSIPRLTVYGPDGKLVADGLQARELVIGWLGH
jgi:thiol-disulfide isomerase/thioredoxin